MRYYYITILPLALCVSCGPARHASVSDSTRVTVREVTRYVKDTVYLELPVIAERIVTRDTSSRLENDYAVSEASVSGGYLSHSLATKPARTPVETESREVVRDSIVFRDRLIEAPVEVEVPVEVEKPLSRWQRTLLALGRTTLAMLCVAALWMGLRIARKLG